MDLSFTAFAAFLLFFLTLARAAPAVSGAQDACAAVRVSSVILNQVAKDAVKEHRATKLQRNFNTSLAWIEAKDMCDPNSLKHKSLPCLGKILSVLLSYSAEVKRVSTFQSCSAFASKAIPALDKLHRDMSTCVNSFGEQDEKSLTSEEEPTSSWEKDALCHYIMARLFSFSILTARVFAVGDPTLHSSSTTKCM